ncbi:tetratricopeptide repeat protein [Polyangium sp. 6x1]|uniref:tetratricopeptide repeat protein n=1 Tax=Polyangium sp. 6x1 TaxID=3042689 RepID=UPI00248304BD|nr:tetratricopeptide repeat protein [Polyangium sp. 6x1]MDI1450810.1 tetratricopeptide repeat protein [Polyangium sp. 6x1]
MLTATVESDRVSSALPEGPLPMRGAILNALASALRLGDKTRTPSDGFSGVTAKRILKDDPAVTLEKRTALTRLLVKHLFTPEYLRARGLDDGEAHIHDEVLVEAIEELLDRWEVLVRQCNHVTGPLPTSETLLKVSGIELDAVTRAAAYLCVYGRLHPVLESLEAWMSKPGLSGVFEELVNRAGRISLDRLCKDARLQKNTIKALRDGKVSEPQGETIEQLAHALAKHGVPRRNGEGDMTAAEISFELRVAAALVRAREALSSEARRGSIGQCFVLLRHLRSELRRYTPEELTGLVVRGRASPLWPAVEAMALEYTFASTVQHFRAIAAGAAQDMQLLRADPAAGARKHAEDTAAQAAHLREVAEKLGGEAHELLAPLIEFEEYSADFMRRASDIFAGKAPGPAAHAAKDHASRIEALGKMMSAMKPWDPPTPEEKLQLLREAVAAYPSFVPPRVMLAGELAARGQHDEALAYLHALVGEHPENPRVRYDLALRLAHVLRYAEALTELDEVERRGGYGPDAKALRGECLLGLGRVEEAEVAFAQALEDNPRLVMALQGMARCRRMAGDERKAREFERHATYYGEGSHGRAQRTGWRSEP